MLAVSRDDLNDATDPMMEQIVKTATQATMQAHKSNTPVERRKRSRNKQRKSREYNQLVTHDALRSIAQITTLTIDAVNCRNNGGGSGGGGSSTIIQHHRSSASADYLS